jgi:hypothetical protein
VTGTSLVPSACQMKASADDNSAEPSDGGASRSSAQAMRERTGPSMAAGRDFVPPPFPRGWLGDFRFGMEVSGLDDSGMGAAPLAFPLSPRNPLF